MITELASESTENGILGDTSRMIQVNGTPVKVTTYSTKKPKKFSLRDAVELARSDEERTTNGGTTTGNDSASMSGKRYGTYLSSFLNVITN